MINKHSLMTQLPPLLMQLLPQRKNKFSNSPMVLTSPKLAKMQPSFAWKVKGPIRKVVIKNGTAKATNFHES